MRTTVLLSLLLLTGVQAQAGEAAPERTDFRMKQDAPSIGTNIRRDTVTGSPVPFDRTYAQLTDAQKEAIRSLYEEMKPGDEPPYPLKGLGAIYGPISELQRRLDVEGKLSMYVDVDSEGQATSVSVIASPDEKLTAAVANILMLQRFKPAVCGGSPCRMQFPVRIRFTNGH